MTPPPTAARERPALFADAMVRAILAGRKSATRRPIKAAPGKQSDWLTADLIASVPHGEMVDGGWQMHHPRAGTRHAGVEVAHDSPLGWVRAPWRVGDLLWVRCAFATLDSGSWEPCDIGTAYAARFRYDDDLRDCPRDSRGYGYRPGIHLPRRFARLFLRVTAVRAERLQAITEEGARAEGVEIAAGVEPPGALWVGAGEKLNLFASARTAFASLWDSIYGTDPAKRWAADPWVFATAFERAEASK